MQEFPTSKINNNNWPSDWLKKTSIMGVINVTPDSFSDGGVFADPEDALLRASQCLHDGANVLDIGGQSTRPGANYISAEEEIRRTLPVIKMIRSAYPNCTISIDTFNASVAEQALEAGANWINDISGARFDQRILKLAALSGCPYIITHSRGDSKSMNQLENYNNVVNEVYTSLKKLTDKAISFGIDTSNIIWDPGIGFSKNKSQNVEIIRNLETFTQDNIPLLIGSSRKRFIGEILNEEDPIKRIQGNIAIVCRCVQAGVSLVRVHDIKETYQAILMANEIW